MKKPSPKKRTDWEALAAAAIKHSKKHPEAPEVKVPGYYYPNSVTSLKRRRYLGGKPITRWHISCVRQGNVVPGKGQVVLHYLTKAERRIYGID